MRRCMSLRHGSRLVRRTRPLASATMKSTSFWRYCRRISSTTGRRNGFPNRAETTIRELSGKEMAMLRMQKTPKRKSVLDALMRNVQGTAEQKLALFEKLRAAGGFAQVSEAELKSAEDT